MHGHHLVVGGHRLTLAHINLGIERAPWGKKRVAIGILASPLASTSSFPLHSSSSEFFYARGRKGGAKILFYFFKREKI